jgi:hypothetical protein
MANKKENENKKEAAPRVLAQLRRLETPKGVWGRLRSRMIVEIRHTLRPLLRAQLWKTRPTRSRPRQPPAPSRALRLNDCRTFFASDIVSDSNVVAHNNPPMKHAPQAIEAEYCAEYDHRPRLWPRP